MKVIFFLELLYDVSRLENLKLEKQFIPLIQEANEITAILVSSLKTVKTIRKSIIVTHKYKMKFQVVSDYKPTGDQPQAIKKIATGIVEGENIKLYLVLLVWKNIYNCKCN